MPRRAGVVLTLASLLAVVPAASSGASGASAATFRFYGSGFGHGIGMSQWGAYGLALKGWSHQRILTHYYSGTTVAKATSEPTRIRVGLVDGVQAVHLSARNGPVTIRVEAPAKTAPVAWTIPGGATDLLKGGSGRFVLFDAAGARVGKPVDGSKRIYATYADAKARLFSPEAGHTYNRGFVEIDDYSACGTCGARLRMIAVVTPQEYLYGLGEVPSSWPMQAMEAQADAGRTYAEFLIKGLGQHRGGCNCGVYDDTRNQVYAAWDHEGEYRGARWDRAVDDTAAEVVLYKGALIEAQYMSSSGGYTEDVQNVWGGTAVPYLQGVCDPGDYNSANPARAWQVSMTAAQVTSRLQPYTGNIGTVTRFGRIHRGVSGRLLSLTAVGTTGSASLAGSTFRGALGLLDDRVWIDHDKNVTGHIRVKYDAIDCAPGMPSTPQLAVPGGVVQRFAVGAIYRNTGASVTVWLHGPIESKYVALRESSGLLGPPLSGLINLTAPPGCDTKTCAKARFTNGVIYFRSDAGAHELHGAVLQDYLAAGAAKGHLGFPTTDVTATDTGGTRATFSGQGSGPIVVTCAKDGACTESPAL
jgi:SpoIID/LytB domain protein